MLGEFAVAAGGPPDLAGYGGIVLVGRAFSAACDVLTLVATFLLGRLVWGTPAGLLAAAFYGVAVLPIQAAHFWTVDTSATLFATIALVFLVRLARFGHKADALAFGAALGLGLACKISIAPLILLLPLALYWAPRLSGASAPGLIRRLALRGPELALAVIGMLACFRLASPYAFVGPTWSDVWPAAPFFEQIQEARRLAAGGVDFPPNWQWLARVPWVDAGRDLLVWGLGPLLGGAVVFGVVAGGLRLARATPAARGRALVWLWVVGYFVWMGQQWVASMRYFLPLYPALCVLAAGWLVLWWRRRRFACHHRTAALRPSPAALAIATVLVGTTLWALAFHHIHVTLHPYVAATHWMLRHVEAPVSARIEAADGTLPLVNWPVTAALGDAAATDVVVSAVVPADGMITHLRLHRVTLLEAAPAPTIRLEVLDRDGRTIGATATVDLPFGPDAAPGAKIDDFELALATPTALRGGAKVGLRLVVRGGIIRLSGSRIVQEGAWNDSIPTRVVRLPGTGALDLAGPSGTAARDAEGVDPFGQGYYVPLDLDMATEDDARKRTRLLERLDAGEWLVVANQRFYASMTRNPLRFPLATQFYDALFGGELGYSIALVAASPPRIAGIAIPDQALPTAGQPIGSRPWARWMPEEAFSVYDHPTVFVLRKDPGYTRAGAERALAGLELADVQTALGQAKPALAGRLAWSTGEASVARDGLLRQPDVPRPPPAATTGDEVGGGLSQGITALWWYAFSLLLGLLAWPWLAALWPELPDRGFGVARVVGLVVLALPAWWLATAGIPAWTSAGLTALLCAFAAATALAAWSRRPRGVRIPPPVLRVALVAELAFAALFAIGIGLRLANPDLWAPTLGGEKPMDFALFNRVLATDTFPPADPWFSGGRLNYYYFGWVLAGVLAKLTGAPASLAYNLALPTWFAMTGVAAGALAYNAVARAQARATATATAWTAAAVALAAAVLLGNLDLPRVLAPAVDDVRHALAGNAPVTADALGDALRRHSERWFWAPSRTVGELPGASHEINEFPAFSFRLRGPARTRAGIAAAAAGARRAGRPRRIGLRDPAARRLAPGASSCASRGGGRVRRVAARHQHLGLAALPRPRRGGDGGRRVGRRRSPVTATRSRHGRCPSPASSASWPCCLRCSGSSPGPSAASSPAPSACTCTKARQRRFPLGSPCTAGSWSPSAPGRSHSRADAQRWRPPIRAPGRCWPGSGSSAGAVSRPRSSPCWLPRAAAATCPRSTPRSRWSPGCWKRCGGPREPSTSAPVCCSPSWASRSPWWSKAWSSGATSAA